MKLKVQIYAKEKEKFLAEITFSYFGDGESPYEHRPKFFHDEMFCLFLFVFVLFCFFTWQNV